MVMPALPPPDWMPIIPREDILAQLRADMPGVSLRETDPAAVATDAAASYAYNLVLFFNVAAVNALPQYAVGSYLEAWAAVNQVVTDGLTEDELRYAIFAAPNSWRQAQGTAGKILFAQAASPDVAQATISRVYDAGRADVYILATRGATDTGHAIGTPSAALRALVKAYLEDETRQEAYFSVDTPAPEIRSYSVALSVEYNPSAAEAEVRQALVDAISAFNDRHRRLGGDVVQSRFAADIYAAHAAVELVSLTQFQRTDFDGSNPVGQAVDNLYATTNAATPSTTNTRQPNIAYSMREPAALTLAVSP